MRPAPAIGDASSWFQRAENDPESRLRLFCFPYAGGGTSIFRFWPRQLGPRVAVTPALLPGREERAHEPLCTRFESIVEPLVQQIGPYLDRPFALFGHSMGALIAFELARRVRAEYGVEPNHLFVSGQAGARLFKTNRRLHELPEPEFLALVRRLNGTPREVLADAQMRAIIFRVLRADFAVCDTYSYVPDLPLKCPITVLGGAQDYHVGRAQLGGWVEHTTGNFRLHLLAGNHFFINHSQYEVLGIVNRTLNALLAETENAAALPLH